MLIPELAVNPLGTRIIEAFFTDELVFKSLTLCIFTVAAFVVLVVVVVFIVVGRTPACLWRVSTFGSL